MLGPFSPAAFVCLPFPFFRFFLAPFPAVNFPSSPFVRVNFSFSLFFFCFCPPNSLRSVIFPGPPRIAYFYFSLHYWDIPGGYLFSGLVPQSLVLSLSGLAAIAGPFPFFPRNTLGPVPRIEIDSVEFSSFFRTQFPPVSPRSVFSFLHLRTFAIDVNPPFDTLEFPFFLLSFWQVSTQFLFYFNGLFLLNVRRVLSRVGSLLLGGVFVLFPGLRFFRLL